MLLSGGMVVDMKINTRDFGCVEADEKDIITFVKPILGFEDYRHFIMLYDDEIGSGFAWLQSVEEQQLCFVMANPALLGKEYAPRIPEDCLEALGGEVTEKWLMSVIGSDISAATVNLKSPVVFNMNKFVGAQVVCEDDLPIKYGLFSGKESD